MSTTPGIVNATRPPRERHSPLRAAAIWTTSRLAAGLQHLRGNRCADGFGILMYHRVASRVPGVAAPTWNVTPSQLRRQLGGLLQRGFECWPLPKLVAARRESRHIPAQAFAITFDDGYENNLLAALPVLREMDLPATIFVATKYLDSDRAFPFDDWPARGSHQVPPATWRPLTTPQCDELIASGLIDLGAHTHSHCARPDVHEFGRDLEVCLEFLRDRFAIERPTFALPFGDDRPELIGAARQTGVTCCLTVRDRRVQPREDPFSWARLTVEAADSPTVLAAKLSGWHTTTWSAAKTLARPLLRSTRPQYGIEL